MAPTGHPAQMISRDGNLDKSTIDNLITDLKTENCGHSYGVVAIIGPQGSGKSSLLNQLFNTKFAEKKKMQTSEQTTIGIWISSSYSAVNPIILLDMEGFDSKERGEDGTLFERQSALLAVASADVVLINIWSQDLGRFKAAGMDMFRTVLQAMTKRFRSRERTIMFVIRDYESEAISFECLKDHLMSDMKMIWESILDDPMENEKRISDLSEGKVSPPTSNHTRDINDLLHIEITALPSRRHYKEEFESQTAKLRFKLLDLINDRTHVEDKTPLSGFGCSMEQIWQQIKGNHDVDLPNIQDMAAKFHCAEIAKDSVHKFKENEDWQGLKESVENKAPVTRFCETLWKILQTVIDWYDEETLVHGKEVQIAERQQLMSDLLQVAYPIYQEMLARLYEICSLYFRRSMDRLLSIKDFERRFLKFKTKCTEKFDGECAGANIIQFAPHWDVSRTKRKLIEEIDAYKLTSRDSLLSKHMETIEENISAAMSEKVGSILREGSFGKSWTHIRKILQDQCSKAEEDIREQITVSGLDLDKQTWQKMIQRLNLYARHVVEKAAREEAQPDRVINNMVVRFEKSFNSYKNYPSSNACGNVEGLSKASYQFNGVLGAIVLMRLNDEDEAATDERLMRAINDLMYSPILPMDWQLNIPSTFVELISPKDYKYIWKKAYQRIYDTYLLPVIEMRKKSNELGILEREDENRKQWKLKADHTKNWIIDALESMIPKGAGDKLGSFLGLSRFTNRSKDEGNRYQNNVALLTFPERNDQYSTCQSTVDMEDLQEHFKGSKAPFISVNNASLAMPEVQGIQNKKKYAPLISPQTYGKPTTSHTIVQKKDLKKPFEGSKAHSKAPIISVQNAALATPVVEGNMKKEEEALLTSPKAYGRTISENMVQKEDSVNTTSPEFAAFTTTNAADHLSSRVLGVSPHNIVCQICFTPGHGGCNCPQRYNPAFPALVTRLSGSHMNPSQGKGDSSTPGC